MQSEQFFVSVIIPVYNGEAFLAEAIESILQQNYHPLEIIIADDGSTDGTARIAKSFDGNFHYFYQPNRGPSAARNAALKMARGNVIGFLDADDLWPLNKLELQLGLLVANPSIELVQGRIQYMRLSNFAEDKPLFEKFAEPCISANLGAAIFRRSVFDRIGLFDETLGESEDTDWFMRARENGVSMVVLEQVTLLYRRHQHNITHRKNVRDIGFIKVLQKSLVRRRNQSNGIALSLPKLSDFDESKLSGNIEERE